MAKILARVKAYNLELLPINFYDILRGKSISLYLYLQKTYGKVETRKDIDLWLEDPTLKAI